jgi:hypothetical protein
VGRWGKPGFKRKLSEERERERERERESRLVLADGALEEIFLIIVLYKH